MEKLIRKILNYDAQTATKEQSEEMCATVAALTMFLLDKTGNFNLPENIDIKYCSDIQDGRSNKGEIKLYSEIFRSPEKFLDDISIVAHEITHIAQRHFKDKSKIIRNEDTLVCAADHYYVLECFIAVFEFPQLSDIIEYYGLLSAENFSDELRNLHYYFKSFYELQSFEIEAYDSCIEVINYIIKLAHTLDLSPAEMANLKALEEGSKRAENFYAMQNFMKNLRQDEAYAKEVKRYIKDLRQYFYENEPELMATINSEKGVDTQVDEWQSIILALCLSLEIDYDDELAHNLYNSMTSSKQSYERDSILLELALWTKLNLSAEELKNLENIYNHYLQRGRGSFSTVLNDKKRVQSEINAINNNLKLDICEFNFGK